MESKARLEELFRQNHRRLCGMAYKLVNDRDVAKDIVQEVFIKLWNSRDRVDWSGEIERYLFKATTNTSLNYLRSIKRLVRIESEQHIVETIEASSGVHDAAYTEFEAHVRAAIQNLPPKCRAIYLLSREEGMKYTQIAETLDISVKTVENQMVIALQKLREDLKPYLIPGMTGVVVLLGLLFYFFW